MHVFQDERTYVNYETSQICNGLGIEPFVSAKAIIENTDALEENEPREKLNFIYKKQNKMTIHFYEWYYKINFCYKLDISVHVPSEISIFYKCNLFKWK